MIVTVKQSRLSGKVDANPSKSYTQRAYALAALADSPSVIRYPSWSDDGRAALSIAEALGAEVRIEDDGRLVRINPGQKPVKHTWNAGESGLSLRMFSPIAAAFGDEISIDGHGTLRTRPTGFIRDTLEMAGVRVGDSDTLPLMIQGPMLSGVYEIDGSFSSQLLTGLLIASPLVVGGISYNVSNLKSTPYIDMTTDMMRSFGAEVEVSEDYRHFHVSGSYHGAEIEIEADWSGLAFIIVAGAIAGNNVKVDHVQSTSLQADRAILDAMDRCGGNYRFTENGIEIAPTEDLRAFTMDATNCPDLFPPLAVLASQCRGQSRIAGVHRLKHKETDRASGIVSEFSKVGITVSIDGDEMVIQGKQPVKGGEASSLGDHRMAMALACLGLVAQTPVTIDHAESIGKSYPGFYDDMRLLGARV